MHLSGHLSSALVRATSPLVRRIPGSGARKLHEFARAEAGSMLDLRHAAAATTSVARRALYLRHALDEARHARLFSQAGDALRAQRGEAPIGPPRAEPDGLWSHFQTNGGELGFVAFVFRGERSGRIRLEAFRDRFATMGDTRTVAVFDAVLEDERRHESYTHALLVELAGSEREARRALRRAARWQAFRAFRRAGRAIVEPIWFVLSILLFVLLFPLAIFMRRRVRGGFRAP